MDHRAWESLVCRLHIAMDLTSWLLNFFRFLNLSFFFFFFVKTLHNNYYDNIVIHEFSGRLFPLKIRLAFSNGNQGRDDNLFFSKTAFTTHMHTPMAPWIYCVSSVRRFRCRPFRNDCGRRAVGRSWRPTTTATYPFSVERFDGTNTLLETTWKKKNWIIYHVFDD